MPTNRKKPTSRSRENQNTSGLSQTEIEKIATQVFAMLHQTGSPSQPSNDNDASNNNNNTLQPAVQHGPSIVPDAALPAVDSPQNNTTTDPTVVTMTREEWSKVELALQTALSDLDAIRSNLTTNPPSYVLLIYDFMRPNDPILHSSLDHRFAAAILLQMFDNEYPSLGLSRAAELIMQQYATERNG